MSTSSFIHDGAAVTEHFEIASATGTEAKGRPNLQDEGAVMLVTHQMERMRQMPLLCANPELAGKLCSAMHSNQSSILQVLPERLDMLSKQVYQVKKVLGARFAEVMLDGVPDAVEAKKILDTMITQLFQGADGKGVLQSLQEEIDDLKQGFKAEHVGLEQCIQGTKTQIMRKKMCAKVFNMIYTPLSMIFNERNLDNVFLGAAATSMLATTAFGSMNRIGRSRMLGLAAAGIVGLKMYWYGESSDFQREQAKLDSQTENANQIITFCNHMECLLAEVEKDIKTVELHRVEFLNQVNQIDLLLQNRLDVGRWNADRLAAFLVEQNLEQWKESFVKHGISGKAFLDVLDEEQLRETLGIEDTVTLHRLLKIQADLRNGRFMEPSSQVATLVATIQDSLEDLDSSVQHIKHKLQRVFPW